MALGATVLGTGMESASARAVPIARDTSSGLIGHVNMSALCGSGASLVAAGYLGGADIHPQSEAACNFFFDRLFENGIFGSGGARLRPARRWGGR